MRPGASIFGMARRAAPPDRTTARRPRVVAAVLLILATVVAGCSSRPYGDLVIGPSAPGASTVDLMVATTRAPVVEPAGVIFGGARGKGLQFADIAVSIPPERHAGDVQWPSQAPGDPTRDFVTVRVDRMNLAEAQAAFNARVKATPGRRVLIFVHGYNTRFEEAVYRFAQIVHDAGVPVAPVLFTWPSGGNVFDYVYDRDSAMYSRDAFETVLQALDKNPNVGSISILAHSMGNYLTVETLRQMAIRDRGLPPKIREVMLASPDIDVDVFRRQIAEIGAEKGQRPADFTLFVSRDDKALGISSFLARDTTRLGALDPTAEPYATMLKEANVRVVDLTHVQSDDPINHSKFASGEVVTAIGARLAQGQPLTDAKAGLVETFGAIAKGTVGTVTNVAVDTVTAPAKLVDRTRNEKSVDTAADAIKLAPE